MKEMRKQLTKEAIRDAQMAMTGGTKSDLMKCSKCKKNNCTYNQVGGRWAGQWVETWVGHYCIVNGSRKGLLQVVAVIERIVFI